MISSTAARCSISSRSAGPWRSSCQKKPRCIFSVRPAMMLSSVVMPRNSATFWKVRAMPPAARRRGRIFGAASPLKVMRPCCG